MLVFGAKPGLFIINFLSFYISLQSFDWQSEVSYNPILTRRRLHMLVKKFATK